MMTMIMGHIASTTTTTFPSNTGDGAPARTTFSQGDTLHAASSYDASSSPTTTSTTRYPVPSRRFFAAMTILFCWRMFWDAASRRFRVHWRFTYFALYISIVLLVWLGPVAGG